MSPIPRLLVAGLINIETTLKVDAFPLSYQPVQYPFFGIHSTVSGVGFNISKALHMLGNPLQFVSLIGRDFAGALALQTLRELGLRADFILPQLEHTPQSVILYEDDGRRMIYTDLKDIQDHLYPQDPFAHALKTVDLAVLCNINFTRPYLAITREAGCLVATDVHTIADLDDPYNRDYMAAAHILFMSDERLPCAPAEWAQEVQGRYGTPIIGIGMGDKGALLAIKEDQNQRHFPAIRTRSVVNTIGAGDALFSAFLHEYLHSRDPYLAMAKAVVYASHKIGEAGAAAGLLSSTELDILYHQTAPNVT